VAKIWVDPKTNEAYVADGYRNKRVAVLDAETGKMKRFWGAYGNKPDDADLGKYDPAAAPPKQFRNPVHCVERSNDGLVYVCDRQADRLQVFNADGTFVKEAHFAKNTLGSGSTWDLAFSRDPQQKYVFIADGTNEVVRVVARDTLQEITNFGDGGRQPGSSTACTASPRTRRATSIRPRRTRASACRNSLQGRGARAVRQPGSAVAA
jgi:DNA-binding beta-propeller fold protein YncE